MSRCIPLPAIPNTACSMSGEYEVNYAAGDATTAYVTDDQADARD
jgi:hypothetical protein